MEKKKSGSSPHARQRARKEKPMKGHSEELDRQLKAVVRLRDEDIDTSDISEVTDWSKAVVGKFYRPIKEAVTLRLDADVLAWLKSGGPGYQTRINSVLREAMAKRSEVKMHPEK